MAADPSDVVVVGASAGGVEALREFAAGLPADLTAAVLVVLHLPAGAASALAPILDRSGPLPAEAATHGAPLRAGRIYTAVPDHHLLVVDSRAVLSRGPTESGHRPAVDALFRSAALNWRRRAIGVVLSGAQDDGTAGLGAIKSRGGLAVVQDPDEALYRGMPDNARAAVPVDHVLRARDIGTVVARALRERGPEAAPAEPPESLLDEIEGRIDAGDMTGSGAKAMTEMSQPSGLSCPDCQGVLITIQPARRFRCRVGHAWTALALLQQQSVEVETALWVAFRALEEKEQLAHRMRADAARHGHDGLAMRYGRDAVEVADAAEVLRNLLLGGPDTTGQLADPG